MGSQATAEKGQNKENFEWKAKYKDQCRKSEKKLYFRDNVSKSPTNVFQNWRYNLHILPNDRQTHELHVATLNTSARFIS